jgi:ABC-type sulfate/molybdate transport systems ATPase subunit
MARTDDWADESECTTTGSFADHDIEDGARLIQRTYYRLKAGDMAAFEPTEDFFDALESAFVWAYLGSVDERGVPDHVQAAIDDATAFTREEFADRPDADLRTDVIPAFYHHAAGFHCKYR